MAPKETPQEPTFEELQAENERLKAQLVSQSKFQEVLDRLTRLESGGGPLFGAPKPVAPGFEDHLLAQTLDFPTAEAAQDARMFEVEEVVKTLALVVLETQGHGYDGPTHSKRVRILEAFAKGV